MHIIPTHASSPPQSRGIASTEGWMDCVKKIMSALLSKCFFAGYDPLTQELSTKRTNELISSHKAIPFSCPNITGKSLDVLSLCANRAESKGIVVFAETTSYQDRLLKQIPHQYEYFLEYGFEVIVWNPSSPRFSNKDYASDLACVLKEVRKMRGDAAPILVKAHCATVEPTLSAATELTKQDSVVLILDRGYADAGELARSTTAICAVPFIQSLIQEEFTCDGTRKLQQFKGRIVWVSPKDPCADQMTYWPRTGENLTDKMRALRESSKCSQDDHWIPLGADDHWIPLGANSDHWSHWDKEDYKAMSRVLLHMKVINQILESPHAPQREPVPFCRRIVMPYLLTKAWF